MFTQKYFFDEFLPEIQEALSSSEKVRNIPIPTTEKERGAQVGENNCQATHGARKHAWRMQAAWAKKSF